jgi:hypothetical protein
MNTDCKPRSFRSAQRFPNLRGVNAAGHERWARVQRGIPSAGRHLLCRAARLGNFTAGNSQFGAQISHRLGFGLNDHTNLCSILNRVEGVTSVEVTVNLSLQLRHYAVSRDGIMSGATKTSYGCNVECASLTCETGDKSETYGFRRE